MAIRPGLAVGKIGRQALSSVLQVDLWRRAESLFEAALDQNLAERPEFLQRACGGDGQLLNAVQALLERDRSAGSFLDEPLASPLPFPGEQAGESPWTGRRLGPYRLLNRLGEGGMSQVFLGERTDGEVQQQVAIKFLPDDLRDARLLRSLRRERQILASLDHPNIARFLDGGTTEEGLPYVVLEYVQGMPLTEYCDVRRLGVRQRLEMFRKVCHAVEYAHRRLVVHRDLKPGNILVTDEGEPKLLDFGIAKLLDSTLPTVGRDETQTLERFLTPAYASPEQIAGGPVSTATDIYSLGILLYQTLTGLRPQDLPQSGPDSSSPHGDVGPATAPSEALAFREGSQPRAEARGTTPSHLSRQLVGDLDSVTLHCLHPLPQDRYPSVAALDEDLRRYLFGLPVAARQQRWSYRMGKFLRRNAAAVAFAALAAIALVGLGVSTALQNQRITRERDSAEQSRAAEEEVTRFLTEAFTFSTPYRRPALPGDSDQAITVEDVLKFSAERVRGEFAQQPLLKARLLHTLGVVYTDLGHLDEAEAFHRDALEIRRLHATPPRLEIAASLNGLGLVLGNEHRFSEAAPLVAEALEIARAAGPAGLKELAESLTNIGMVSYLKDDLPNAESPLREALEIRQASLEPGSPELTLSLLYLGRLLTEQGNLEEAARHFHQALEDSIRAHGRGSARTANILGALGTVLTLRRQFEAAESYFREALEVQVNELGPEHPNSLAALGALGLFLREKGDYPAAEKNLRAALELEQRTTFQNPQDVAVTLNNLGLIFLDQGRNAEAETHFREALELAARLPPSERPGESARLRNLGLALHSQGRALEAEPLMHQAIALFRKNLTPDNPILANGVTSLAAVLVSLGRHREALAETQEALSIYRTAFPESHPRLAQAENVQGAALAGLGRFQEAEVLLRRGYENLLAGDAPPRVTNAARKRLENFYLIWDKPDQAENLQRRPQ